MDKFSIRLILMGEPRITTADKNEPVRQLRPAEMLCFVASCVGGRAAKGEVIRKMWGRKSLEGKDLLGTTLSGLRDYLCTLGCKDRTYYVDARASEIFLKTDHITSDVLELYNLLEQPDSETAEERRSRLKEADAIANRGSFLASFEFDEERWEWAIKVREALDEIRQSVVEKLIQLDEKLTRPFSKRYGPVANSPAGGPDETTSREYAERAATDYDLRSVHERVLLSRLSLFADGFTADAAKSVCAGGSIKPDEVKSILQRLCSEEIVLASGNGVHARYFLPISIRECSGKRFAASIDADTYRRTYLQLFVEFAQNAGPKLREDPAPELMHRLNQDHLNFSAAIDVALENDLSPQDALVIVAMLQNYLGAYVLDGIEWCERSLRHPANLAWTGKRAEALKSAGVLYGYNKRFDVAKAYDYEAIKIFKSIKDLNGELKVRNNLALLLLEKGNRTAAKKMLMSVLSKRRKDGDEIELGNALLNLANVYSYLKQWDEAKTYLAEFIEVCSRRENLEGVANGCLALGNIDRVSQDYPSSWKHLLAALDHYSKPTIDVRCIPNCLESLAYLAVDQNQMERAAILLSAAQQTRTENAVPLPELDKVEFDEAQRVVGRALGARAFKEASAYGGKTDLKKVIEFARSTMTAPNGG